ncbi:hypothetical protein [Nonomuraea sp. NPDC050202]|uniref:hypothetical protein n=1 Tax=Nonomuraea sp. NPDC050202 TaxID=3155035 RepID=UPI00340634D6
MQERLGGAPDQEGGDVPGVQVGLGAAAEAGVVIIHPGQEGSGLAEDAAGVLVAFRAEGLPVGDRAELAQQVPGGEAFEQAPVLDVVDAGEPFGQPSLKQQQVPVDGAVSTGSDRRSGGWVTRRQTCTQDSLMPRSCRSGSRSVAANMPATAIISRRRH